MKPQQIELLNELEELKYNQGVILTTGQEFELFHLQEMRDAEEWEEACAQLRSIGH